MIIIANLLNYLLKNYQKCPDKIAVSDKDNKYTYRELYNKSKQIARLLSNFDLQNKPIAVMGNPHISTIALFFGVLYSGNFYVPIDPEMPTEKMQMIFNDADFAAVFGVEDNRKSIHDLSYNGKFYTLSDFKNLEPSDKAVPEITGNEPAYMVYTSGSTGVPKGVVKSHNAVISFIEAFTATFEFSENEIIGNQTPFFFDASAKDIYLMLKLGCTMEILPSTLFSLPPELIDYINKRKVTYACWVPTVLSIVAQLNPFSFIVPKTLTKLFFVGEVMQIKHLKKWVEALPAIQYVNLYGASETAGVCCYHEVKPEDLEKLSLPIGKPFNNCRIYLTDNETVINCPDRIGELYVASDTIALEYFHDPKKTNTAFQHRNFGNGIERCFKTGDLAQYDKNGNLVFATRTDFQIKHMGHRIELGEIESICSGLDMIDRCCCVYNPSKKKIILICTSSAGLKPQEIRSFLKSHLSSYMLPGAVVVLDELPLNANGKIDRNKLKEIYTK